tara:strand:- start:13681 stop:14427 length:747 start_codon:yes stop_codon:yes gene_type:complete
MKLKNKIAVITGGNSGIGFATAKLFQEEGAKVIITGRRQDAVDTAMKELGGDVIGITTDASIIKDIDKLYKEVDDFYGKIDVLFLNAGVATFEPIEAVTEETYDRQMNTNLKGLFFNIQKALPLLKNGGSIILTTSAADQKGFSNTSVYSATKAAVRNLSRTLSAELLDRGIRVNSIAPGPIETPLFDKLGFPQEGVVQVKEQFLSTNPMKRMGTPEEVAKGVLFLASNDSSYVAGIDLSVDGGVAKL